jgi:hypothetical protein
MNEIETYMILLEQAFKELKAALEKIAELSAKLTDASTHERNRLR